MTSVYLLQGGDDLFQVRTYAEIVTVPDAEIEQVCWHSILPLFFLDLLSDDF